MCASMYRIVNGSPHEYTQEEQKKSRFTVVFNKKQSRLKTSDGFIYTATTSNVKGKLFVKKLKVNGRNLTYKLKLASKNGLYKSLSVTGYGNLVNDYVICQKMKTPKKVSDTNSTD